MKGPRTNHLWGPAARRVGPLAVAALFLLVGVASASGPPSWIGWWTVDGGGGTASSGAGYVLTGTMGQPDAGTMSGGEYVLGGGFWAGGATAPPTCPVPLTGVLLDGPGSGQTGQELNFDANPQPSDATEPIIYTWSEDGLVAGQGTDQASYQWAASGQKMVRVMARNCGGEDWGDKRLVDIDEACPKPIVGVSITGPISGYVNLDYVLIASTDPSEPTAPLTITWSSDGLVDGQGTRSATYRWATTGDHTAAVTVANCGGSQSDEHTVTLSEQPPACDNPITGVSIAGPTQGDVDSDITFTAAVEPANATFPISYAWSDDGLVSGQGGVSATYRWSDAGTYEVTVSATNCGGSRSDTHAVAIGVRRLYLPLVLMDD